MPTWPGALAVPSEPAKKSRSPGWASLSDGTGGADLALLLARARQRDAELPVDVLHESRAVESRRARATPHVGGSFEGLRIGDDVGAGDAAAHARVGRGSARAVPVLLGDGGPRARHRHHPRSPAARPTGRTGRPGRRHPALGSPSPRRRGARRPARLPTATPLPCPGRRRSPFPRSRPQSRSWSRRTAAAGPASVGCRPA